MRKEREDHQDHLLRRTQQDRGSRESQLVRREGAEEEGSEKETGRCGRGMRESEKVILTLLWAGRLRKIREIER